MKRAQIGLPIAIVAVSVLIWFFWERTRTDHVHCTAYLRQIQAAKENWAIDRDRASNAVPGWNDLEKYLQKRPVCPDGGRYTIGRVGDLPKCSFPGHQLGP